MNQMYLEGLDFEPADRPPKVARKPNPGRMTIDAMASLAISAGSASSVQDFLRQVAAVRDRPLFNAFLAVVQSPHASMLCSKQEWEDTWRRRVRPAERPILVMFPFGPVEMLFDVSQTEETDRSRPLPLDAEPFAMDPVETAGDTLQRLEAAAAREGVRVVHARQGVALAGKIRRVHDAGTLTVPVGGVPTRVPVRWIVELNASHSATEKLATLAHELGHLFCGHVGADQGDGWPARDVDDLATEEFEAESVAELVFHRVAPGIALPEYLDQYLDAGGDLPDAGWSYVVQAAEKVLDMCGR